MKRPTATASILLLCCCTGCLSVCNNAYRTLIKEPKEFSWRKDRCESRTLYASWAAGAWAEQRSNGTPCQSADFALGFQDGFVEYCYAGGSGEPPPIPPRPYWNSLNRVAPLDKSAYEWFDGYRLGARVARTGGYRDQAVVPASASLCSKGGGIHNGEACPCSTGEPAYAPQPAPHAEPVPAPAPVSDGQAKPDDLMLPALTDPAHEAAGNGATAALYEAIMPAKTSPIGPPRPSASPVAAPQAVPSTAQRQAVNPRGAASAQATSPRFGNEFLR
ncbi:hypothetical protein KOR34_20300 [Posidoniimonas corsicana]|uniref:Uncharacterized protein n=1 Tax=Posidoniimonas corsicana TaxID=1938618 RepID=A0A5C5VG93_9BACT|nr:hypothetical protein [Posidoniimonas corsicana]TWT37083.1 hypothetical protein KOR34_20300 [Posidoniimonas corsicana]